MLPAKYLEVFNINDQRVAFLAPQSDGVKNARLSRQKNGSVTLKFILPRTSDKWEYITGLHKVKVNGHEFWISGTEEERDQQGKLLSNVQCEETWVRDLGEQRINYLSVEILSSTAENALDTLLDGSGWLVGLVTVTGIHDLESEKQSLLWNLWKVQELWGGVLVFDSINKTVSLLDDADWGQDNGVQIRYGKNQKSIRRKVVYDIVTRLVPLGKDGLTIASVNNGLLYIDNFQYTNKVWEDIWENQEYDDPADLKAAAEKYLAKISRPQVTYTINLVDLSSKEGYEIEAFDNGDWMTMFDPDLSPNGTKSQIYKYEYDVFEPWSDVQVELGDPEENFFDMLADHGRAADLVNNVVRPNPSVGNLLKGVLNTFYTQINGASGTFTLIDGVATYIELDGQGAETGKRVRITPAGIGISKDHGQTYTTALTGDGIAANTVIINTLYALATEDGYTRVAANGLEVYDNQATPVKRLHAGQYATGKFGLELKDKTGQTTILDEDGMMQTWQDSRADNVDATHGLLLNVYLPEETKSIHKAILRFKLQAFRAYETGAASGGGSTSGSGGGTTSSTAAITGNTTGTATWHTSSGYGIPEVMTLAGSHDHNDTGSAGSHAHTLYDHNHTDPQGGGTGYSKSGIDAAGSHSHNISNDGSHAHGLCTHDHSLDCGTHSHAISSHTHTTPNHAHNINYGIYENTTATGVTVIINGIDRTAALGGETGFNSDQSSLDISGYLLTNQWNAVELGSTQLGRIDASVFIQAKMGV